SLIIERRNQIIAAALVILAVVGCIGVFNPAFVGAVIGFAFASILLLFATLGMSSLVRMRKMHVAVSRHSSSQKRNYGMHNPNQTQEQGFYEQLSGGEKWSDASSKRKNWLEILFILTVLSL